MSEHLPISSEQLAEFCRRHHIAKLSIFGSTIHGKQRPDSDIDFLVEFERGREPGLIALGAIELELSQLLEGRKVDIRTPPDLSPYFREQVMQEAELQYAA
jgi:uncharacterized protein